MNISKTEYKRQAPSLSHSIKNLRIDKYINSLRNLRFQLEIYNNKNTMLSDGIKKELLNKILKLAKKITKASKDTKLYNEFKGDKIQYQNDMKSIKTLNAKYEELTILFENQKEKILSSINLDDSKRLKSKYNRELMLYAKENYALSQNNKYVKTIKRREFFSGYMFTIPALLVISIFVLFAVGYALWTSMNIVKLKGAGLSWEFTGLKGYSKIIANPGFSKSLKVSLTYMGMVAPIQTIIALVLSSVLASKIKGNKVFLILYFLPTLTSSTALTMIFLRLAGKGGPLEAFLGAGFAKRHLLGLIAIMNIWSTVPLFITTFNAAHADIPKSQYEAMSIDGAGPVRKFIKVTVPYLRPVTAYVLMMGVIGTLQMFDQAYIISKDPTIGASPDKFQTTAMFIFNKAFKGFGSDFGQASAAAIIFTAIILGFSVVASFVSKPAGGK